MNLAARIKSLWGRPEKPPHLHPSELGERAARKQLQQQGEQVSQPQTWP